MHWSGEKEISCLSCSGQYFLVKAIEKVQMIKDLDVAIANLEKEKKIKYDDTWYAWNDPMFFLFLNFDLYKILL